MVAHCLLALGVVALVLGFAGLMPGLVSGILMAGLLILVAAGRPRGQLRIMHRGSGHGTGECAWAWRDTAQSQWHSVNLECDYLGPWLVGLRLDGRRLWLWPDSCDRGGLRALRRELIRLS